MIEQGKQIAAHVLEASAGDIEFKAGRFVIAGTDRSIGIMELARSLRGSLKLPEGVPTSLDVDHVVTEPVPSTFPNGCHVAEVEVDPETGATQVVKYSAVNDLRHHRQPAAGRGPDPGRRGAGPRPGAAGAGRL